MRVFVDLYEITLTPESAFGSALKGDTLFGHLCWQAAYDPELLNGGLEPWVKRYPEAPAVVISSAYPCFAGDERCYALRRPDRPGQWVATAGLPPAEKRKLLEQRKLGQAKKWLWVDHDLKVRDQPERLASERDLNQRALSELFDQRERPRPPVGIEHFCAGFKQMHNTIDRTTGTTGEGAFAPFEESAMCFLPGVRLAVFVLIEAEATDIERVTEALRRIGRWGYGKNASTGLGRFRVEQWRKCSPPPLKKTHGCYTLGPCVPAQGQFREFYYTPFVRFGRHGDRLAHAQNPFKNPVLMADDGAVGLPADPQVAAKPYVGRAVLGTSKALDTAIAQGYSIYLPIALENGHERTV